MRDILWQIKLNESLLSLCVSFTVPPFILSSRLFFPPPLSRCLAKQRVHSATRRSLPCFDIMCQNRPHCLISACASFSSSSHSTPSFFFLRDSTVPNSSMNVQRQFFFFPSYEWQMQTALVRWVARLPWQTSRLYPHLNLRVVCVLRSTVVFPTEAASGSLR